MKSITPKILVVDDDEAVRDFFTVKLEREGFEIITADCGETALSLIEDHEDIDLILLDVMMPGLSGFDILEIIKKDSSYSQIAVIMVTALGEIGAKERAFELGAADYIVKLADTREMMARIRTHIKLKRSADIIKKQKDLLESIFSVIPGSIWVKNRNREIIRINDQFSDLCRHSREETIGKKNEDLFSPEQAVSMKVSDDLVLEYMVPEIEMMEDYPDSEGHVHHFLTRKKPITGTDGNIEGMVGVSFDLTDQIALRNILAEREALLSSLMDAISGEIWSSNLSGTVIQQNQEHMIRFGNLIGKKYDEIPLPPEQKHDLIEDVNLALQGNKVERIYEEKDENGQKERFISYVMPILCQGVISGVIGVTHAFSLFQREQGVRIITNNKNRDLKGKG